MHTHPWMIAALGALCLWWLPDAPAHAHGGEEIALFSYLAEERNLLRISTALIGAIVLAMGAYIARQSQKEIAAQTSRAKLMAPGVIVIVVGVGILLTAAFVLPEQISIVHDHPPQQGAH